ncbi:MAG: hypothetical protein RAK24_02280 [TACK group archaeon]|nr:hypothetical protein [TACK group archaeon]
MGGGEMKRREEERRGKQRKGKEKEGGLGSEESKGRGESDSRSAAGLLLEAEARRETMRKTVVMMGSPAEAGG